MATVTKRFEILLAEDNAADAELVREALIQHQVNCSLRVVGDGAEAIAFINAIDVDPRAPALDLLLLDVRLPKSDGEEVLRRLRSMERYAQTPIIVMSGLSSTLLKGIASEHPAIVYFKKPSTLEGFMELGSIVRRVLEQGPPGHQPHCGRAI